MKHGAWFNVFLPRFYNDRRPIDDSKFDLTEDELKEQFGGLTVFREPTFLTQGYWRFKSVWMEDHVRIYAVFADDINAARAYLATMKPRWKRRFRQDEIFIVDVGVEVL